MIELILELLLVASPVILAAIFHMVVVRYNRLKFACYPLDHYATFRSHRVFGDNKTYRGIIVMIAASIAFTYLYQWMLSSSQALTRLNLLNFEEYHPVFYGTLYGVGYVIGELPNSFFKRQMGISEGKSTTFISRMIDQLDSVIAITLLLLLFSHFTLTHFWFGILFYGFLHLGINYLLYLLRLRKEPF